MKTFILNGMKLGAQWFIAGLTVWAGFIALFGGLFLVLKAIFGVVGLFSRKGKKQSDVGEVEAENVGPVPAAVANEAVA